VRERERERERERDTERQRDREYQEYKVNYLKISVISASNFIPLTLIAIFWNPGGLYLFNMIQDCCAKVHLIAHPAIMWS